MLDEKDLQAIAEMMKGMESRIDQKLEKQKQEILDESTRRMKLLLDTEVTTRFNLLAEGQQVIMDAITPKSEIEELRNEVSVLKLAIRTMNQEIAELKKAQ
jgi:predicted  nucleic acid-binding Zn-ribbon protein